VLLELASALFPGGEGAFGQLIWNPAPSPAAMRGGGQPPSAEALLRAADLRYRTLVEQIPAVTFLAVLGEGDNEIYVSPYIEALLGFTQQEWLENPFLWYSQLHADDRALWHDEFARGIRTGGPFHAECRFIARNGDIVWVRGEARLVKDDVGRPMFLQGVAFDITESKRAHSQELQEAIRSTEQRYRDLVERLDAIFWEARAGTGEFTFVSGGAETILGFPRARWIADKGFWLDRVHDDDRRTVEAAWTRAQESRGDHEFEFRVLTADQREVWLQLRTQGPVANTPDRYFFGVLLDVTQRRRGDEERARLFVAAEEAREVAETANRAKDEFLATMSHELKTPLNALIGYAQLLRDRQLPAELTERALQSIERNAKAQARLVEDLLDVSRIVTGKLHLDVRPVNLAEVVDAAFDTMRLAADAKNITVIRMIDRSGVQVSGDATRLQQVVWNLLSNAVRFTPERGRIEIRLDCVSDFARIRVADSGQGIGAEFLPHVFERFRQADTTSTRKHGGLGLGLAIVRHILEMHGGTIEVESAGRDQGATFTALIPLLSNRERPEPGPAARMEDNGVRALEHVRILVVDDDADTREMLRTVFARAGAEVTAAESAMEALSAFRAARPDVLVSDIGMPDTDGYELLRLLRGVDPDRAPLAIALTAYTGADHRRRALEAGYREHVSKPVDVEQIVRLVARLANATDDGAHP
jgi:PAS domain S-box-containing protein